MKKVFIILLVVLLLAALAWYLYKKYKGDHAAIESNPLGKAFEKLNEKLGDPAGNVTPSGESGTENSPPPPGNEPAPKPPPVVPGYIIIGETEDGAAWMFKALMPMMSPQIKFIPKN